MTLWGGRFDSRLDPRAWKLNSSLEVDRRLALQDVRGSLAWAKALYTAKVLSLDEYNSIRQGLEKIQNEFKENSFQFHESDEDIHSAVERRLGEIIGSLAGKLHSGRSRNDQVVTDFRLWTMEAMDELIRQIRQLQKVFVERAEKDFGVILPGYTHTQRAQPILLSHWWLAHFWAYQRDRERLQEARQRTAILPLGSGALAGTPFAIDRKELAQELGFQDVSPNSFDAVADRDFEVEFLFIMALLGVHLSRLSEAVILYSSAEYGFFILADEFSTGSSLMPQKKNPDLFELARGQAGKLIGQVSGMLAILKGLPSAYDKDLQEDKELVFTAFDTLMKLLPALNGALLSLQLNQKRMQAALDDTLFATDLADYLVERGVSFRQAHEFVGRAVRIAEERGVTLSALPLEVYQEIDLHFNQDLYQVFDGLRSVERRRAIGGTAPEAVRQQLTQAKQILG
ncbi:MAG: argininosuccinate lyase [Anaerolineales bacterium]